MNLSEEYDVEEYDLNQEKLLLQLNQIAYKNEFERKRDIDTKAINLIGVVSLIITIQTSLGLNFIKNDFILNIIFIISLIFYIISIILFVNAYKPDLFDFAPKPDSLKNYGINQCPQEKIVVETSADLNNAVEENIIVTNLKAIWIKRGLLSLIFAICVTIFYYGVVCFV